MRGQRGPQALGSLAGPRPPGAEFVVRALVVAKSCGDRFGKRVRTCAMAEAAWLLQAVGEVFMECVDK